MFKLFDTDELQSVTGSRQTVGKDRVEFEVLRKVYK